MRPASSLSLLALASLAAVGCSRTAITPPPDAGASAAVRTSASAHMIQYGCPTCHVIPGVPGAVGKVGPSLDGLAQRSYLAGVLPNTPNDLQRWIMHPQQYRPGSAMPEMHVSAQDAAEFSNYLEPSQ